MSFCKEYPSSGVRRCFHLQNFRTKVLTKSHCVKGKMWIKIRKKMQLYYRRRRDFLKGCNQQFTTRGGEIFQTILILAHLRQVIICIGNYLIHCTFLPYLSPIWKAIRKYCLNCFKYQSLQLKKLTFPKGTTIRKCTGIFKCAHCRALLTIIFF